MAYSRFRTDGSDVYILEDSRGFICCMRCSLNGELETRTNTRSEMLAHMEAHRKAGEIVPDYAFENLRAEIATNGDLISP